MGPRNWVVLGIGFAAFGYLETAFALLSSPANFIVWSAVAAGILVAALGLRSLPGVGVLPVLGFFIAALAQAFQLVLGFSMHPDNLPLMLSNAAALLGMAAAAWISWRGRRKAALESGNLRALSAGFLFAALAGAGYFVYDGLAGATQFLVGDAMVIIGLSIAAWKIRAV